MGRKRVGSENRAAQGGKRERVPTAIIGAFVAANAIHPVAADCTYRLMAHGSRLTVSPAHGFTPHASLAPIQFRSSAISSAQTWWAIG
jgi:hypothetical protein